MPLALVEAGKNTRSVAEDRVKENAVKKPPPHPLTQKNIRSLLQENRKLKEALQKKKQELDYFIKAGKALTGTLEFKKVLRIVLSTARKLIRCQDWSLLLISETENRLYCALAKETSLKFLKGIEYKIGEGPAGWVAKNGHPLLVSDFSKQKMLEPAKFFPYLTAKSLLCTPIKSKERVIGVIQMVNRLDQDQFSESDLQLLGKLLDQASLAIRQANVYQKMSDLVTTDDLTHLYNLRYLDRVLEVELKRSSRYNSALSLIFIDLDYFKKVNDQHGHLMGSQVLVELAGILVNSLRAVDVIVRYGGDEFIILLPNTSLKKAGRVAERVINAIRAFKFLKKEGLSLHITASFGIAGYPEQGDNRTDLIYQADRAMYDAKLSGRDRICFSAK